MGHNINITRIKAVSNALMRLKTEIVFAGGAVVSLYADESFREAVRPTDDVDVVVELVAYKDYAAMEAELRKSGFENDSTSKVICRYLYQGLIVDIMPTDSSVLGFSNQWYKPAFKQAYDVVLDEHHSVKIFPVAYFIAAKLEAFKSRGGNDGRTSTDFEDIVFVLNHRSSVWKELNETTGELRSYLKEELKAVLSSTYVDEWISAHLDYHEQSRVDFIIHSLEEFVKES